MRSNRSLAAGVCLRSIGHWRKWAASAPNQWLGAASEQSQFSALCPCSLHRPGPTPHTTWLTFEVDFAFKSPLYRQVACIFFEEVRCGCMLRALWLLGCVRCSMLRCPGNHLIDSWQPAALRPPLNHPAATTFPALCRLFSA